MKMEVLLVGVILMIGLKFLPRGTSEPQFSGSCLISKEGYTVVLKEPTFTSWAGAELNALNKIRTESLKISGASKVLLNPKISQYAAWQAAQVCDEHNLHSFGNDVSENNFYDMQYLPNINGSQRFKMTSCNLHLEQDLGWTTVGVANKVKNLFESYLQDIRDIRGSRVGESLFVPYIREVGLTEIFCHNVTVVTIMSWPPIIVKKDVESDGYFPKCILDNEGNVVSFYEPGSSHEWRLRFLDRVNQFRKQEGLSVLLLNNGLCENVHWSLNELKLLGDKSALKTKTTQGILDTLGRKDWKVQCWDTLFEYNGESDFNDEPEVIPLTDSLRVNKADPLYNQLFSEDTMEICGTYIPIKEPNATGNTSKFDVGIQFLSKELNGGRTPIPDYVEATTTVNGVGNNVLKLWMISLGVIGLQLFIFL